MYIDFHNHVLPGIDDGPQTIEESLELLKMFSEQGVKRIITTPHYDPRKQDLNIFIEERDRSYQMLLSDLRFKKLGIEVKVGAEIYFREEMNHLDLSSLAYQDSAYILVELPTRSVPPGIERTFQNLINEGYNPILAHIERYSILRDDLALFERLIEIGVLMQVNLSTLIDPDPFVKKALKKNYIHLISSDAHDTVHRPPKWDVILDCLENIEVYIDRAQRIWYDQDLDMQIQSKILKIGKFYL